MVPRGLHLLDSLGGLPAPSKAQTLGGQAEAWRLPVWQNSDASTSEDEEEELRSHFAANLKHCSPKSINYGYHTQMVIQCTLSCIDFHTRVLEVLLLRGEETPAWWQHILAGR